VCKDGFPIIFEEDKAATNSADDFDRAFELAKGALHFFSRTISVIVNGLHVSVYLFKDDNLVSQTHRFDLNNDVEEWLPEVCSFLLLAKDVLNKEKLKPSSSNQEHGDEHDSKNKSSSGSRNTRSKDKEPNNSKKKDDSSSSNPPKGSTKNTKKTSSNVPNQVNEQLSEAVPLNVFACNAQVYSGFFKNRPAVAKIAQQQTRVGEIPIEVYALQLLNTVEGIPKLFHWKNISSQQYLLVEEKIPGHWSVSNWQEFTCVFQQALAVLSQIHSRNIVHGDLKPENFNRDRNQVFIIDFDSASVLSPSDKSLPETWMGTDGYRAPELAAGKGSCSFAVDIWSLGICLTKLARNLVKTKASFSEPWLFWNQKDQHFKNWSLYATVVQKMLDKNPNTRVTAAEALSLL